jgi:hypothetical protein
MKRSLGTALCPWPFSPSQTAGAVVLLEDLIELWSMGAWPGNTTDERSRAG